MHEMNPGICSFLRQKVPKLFGFGGTWLSVPQHAIDQVVMVRTSIWPDEVLVDVRGFVWLLDYLDADICPLFPEEFLHHVVEVLFSGALTRFHGEEMYCWFLSPIGLDG